MPFPGRFPAFVSVLCLMFAALSQPGQAQDRARSILVLDASGSMWGQIDGKTKIEIAQTVVGSLLDELPADQELGLTAYGHNRKGDCSDIETLVAPGSGTREAIRSAVMGIKPKGKTPLSAAVIRAAQALRYTEEKATVILVSDGRETCDYDPCEVGRKLEEAGVDFTAHVVGFDVANPADRAQLQCLAENTGGKFITASNASELSTALQEVSAPPPPVELDVTFAAVIEGTSARITDNLVWSLSDDAGESLADFESAASITRRLGEGVYVAEVLRTLDEATAEVTVTIGANSAATVLLELPEYLPDATLAAPDSAEVATGISVAWTGPAEAGDSIAIAPIGAPPGGHASAVSVTNGSPLAIPVPAEPGAYELRYVWKGRTLATRPLEVTPVRASLSADDSGIAGAKHAVTWQGPNRDNDYISIAKIGSGHSDYETYEYTRTAQTVAITLPIEPGDYEIRYILNRGTQVLARKPITVLPVAATVSGAAEAAAGQTIPVEWSGPAYENDYISVARVGAPRGKYAGYTYTREGTPLNLRMPAEPGDYELRYVANQKSTVLARQPIRIVAVTATVSAPDTANAGATVQVDWTGPDYDRDYISVAEPGARDNKYRAYTYTRDGAPLGLRMPPEPGTYEIRYVQHQGATVLARRTIEVLPVSASLSAPERAAAGDDIVVDWTGPDYDRDYISVAELGQPDNKYRAYTYTRDGAPLRLTMPPEPGSYEIRYVQHQGATVLARLPITIEEIGASVSFAPSARIGERLLVNWTGPDYDRDYISVAEPGQPDNKYRAYTYTRDGAPLRLKMPLDPGTYEIRYVQHQGATILARETVVVEPVDVSLTAPDTAMAGEPLLVTWDGPDYDRDYISVAEPGQPDNRYQGYTYTRDGSPLRVTMPVKPGQYELRYVSQGAPDKVLARRMVTVAPVSASLTLSGVAKAGEPALIEWTGPDYHRDYIAIAIPGEKKAESYSYTRDGSPLRLKMPKMPGTYELRYVLDQKNTVIATIPITVE